LATPFSISWKGRWTAPIFMSSDARTRARRAELCFSFRSIGAALAGHPPQTGFTGSWVGYFAPGNYFGAQLSAVGAMYEILRAAMTTTRALPYGALWLSARLARKRDHSTLSCDFRIAKRECSPCNRSAVVRVRDWRRATLGHPRVELAFNSPACYGA